VRITLHQGGFGKVHSIQDLTHRLWQGPDASIQVKVGFSGPWIDSHPSTGILIIVLILWHGALFLESHPEIGMPWLMCQALSVMSGRGNWGRVDVDSTIHQEEDADFRCLLRGVHIRWSGAISLC
jgi:hypothetical protein